MVTIILLAIALALANGSTDIEQMKNDYRIVDVSGRSNHRLAGWNVNGKNNKKCDMVRRSIKKFGYCWADDNEKKGINTSKERGWVREVIQQWEKCGNIKFVEEPKCRKGPDFVTVTIGNYGPVLMPQIDSTTCNITGFTIFMDFYTFGENIESYKTTEKVRKSNVQMYALHEFGHFLGFDHEHNRKDRTECYWQVDASEVGPDAQYSYYAMTKEYDIESIMNYCRPNVHYKPWLSALDKKAVAEAYGDNKINWQECDAVTKPWTWSAGDGLDDNTLKQMQNGGGTVEPPPKPAGCADVATKAECESRRDSCSNPGMDYWCPKTCKFCK